MNCWLSGLVMFLAAAAALVDVRASEESHRSAAWAVAPGVRVEANSAPSLVMLVHTDAEGQSGAEAGNRAAQFVCSAILVGPKVLLAAAHCATPDRAQPGTRIQVSDQSVDHLRDVLCEFHPRYASYKRGKIDWSRPRDQTADFLLCVGNAEFGDGPFETIEIARQPPVGAQLVLAGYGCERPRQEQSAGTLRAGMTRLREVSDASPYGERLADSALYAPRLGCKRGADQCGYNGMILREQKDAGMEDTPLAASACSRDSGGAVFQLGAQATRDFRSSLAQKPASVALPDDRRLVGVISAAPNGNTVAAATAGPDFVPWARSFAERHDVVICGVSGIDSRCRGSGAVISLELM